LTVNCEHGAECHDGTTPSIASAPEASRAWLLIEHQGPWPAEPTEAEFPAPLSALVAEAAARDIRVQLIRRPGRRQPLPPDSPRTVFAGWTAGEVPWLRRGAMSPAKPDLDLVALAAGEPVTFGMPVSEPVLLVCGHGRRNVCCARLGVPLAQALSARYSRQVWETSHVGGHRFAANLVILPHGLYYGPVDTEAAVAAISAYEQGAIVPDRYRGRAGQPQEVQELEHARLTDLITAKLR
jgi:hypothetical protein